MALHWLSLVAAIWLQSISGTNSNFPAYSSELKRLLSISQLQLNNLASASDAAKLLGFLSGIAAAHLPLPLVLLLASLLGAAGYGLQFLFLTHYLPPPSYWQIFILTVIAGNSICWINTVCYIVAIRNFPLDRHVAVGLSTSYVGLTPKIYTDIVNVVAPSSPSSRAKTFLLVNAVLPVLVCIVAAPFTRAVHVTPTRKLAIGFLAMFVVTILTGMFAVITSLVTSRGLANYAILSGMIGMLLLPLVIPLAENLREKAQQKCLIRVHDEAYTSNFSLPENGQKNEDSYTRNDDNCMEEIGAKLMLRRVEFWLYYFVYFFGATLGLVYLNNLGQIAESRGCSRTSSLVSLSSAFTFFGRLLPSLLDYIWSKRKMGLVSGGGAMGAIMIPMCGAFLLLVKEEMVFLYTSTAIIGVCTGAITSISVTTTAELFGVKNFGVNHNILVSNIPIGTFLFGDFAALLYRRGTSNVTGSDGKCMGQICYQTTFIIWGGFCAVGVLLAFILHTRTKTKFCTNSRL